MRTGMALATVLALAAAPLAAHPEHGREPSSPQAVAEAYLAALEAKDLAAAGALYAAQSSIFEGGGEEGTWQAYREHHLGPEIGDIKTFRITRGTPEQVLSADGSMAFVTMPMEYRIELADGTVVDSKGAATFVLVRENDRYHIRHLHWSSRKKR